MPKTFAGLFVEANDGCVVGAADGDEDGVAIDDAGAVVAAPGGGAFAGFAAEEFDAEIFFEAEAPNDFSGGEIEAAEFAFAGLNVDAVAIYDRRAARTGGPFVAIDVADRRLPDFFAGRSIELVDDFVRAVFVEVDHV